MPRQTFIWTALPNGTKQLLPSSLEVGLTLSVFVTPRLQHSVGETRPLTLADFPDLHNWPETVNQMQFLVTFDRGVPLPAAKVSLLGVPADPDRWGALFKTDLRVEPYRFDDHSGDTWLSYPAGELARRIREGYVDATSPDAGGGVELLELVGLLERLLFEKLTLPIVVPPALRPLIDALPDPAIIADLRSLTGILGTIGGEPPVHIPGLPPVTIPGLPPVGLPPVGIPPVDIPGLPPVGLPPVGLPPVGLPPVGIPPVDIPGVPPVVGPGIPPVGTPPLGTIRNPLSEFMGFHMPPLRKERPERLPENRLRQLLDFHEIVSALGDYPAVLRALGLVVDLTIAVPPDLAEALLSAHTVQVRPVRLPTVGQIQTLDVSPATGCFLDGDLFLAAPRPQDPETARGLLDLADGRYQVEQFDIDGTMFKIQGEERSVASLAGTLNPTMPKDVGFPALRTAGITVVRDDLAERFARKAQQAKARNAVVETAERAGLVSADAGDVFAEDLTAGYRVDVWDDVSATWHSLHKRETDFAFVRSPPEASMPNVVNEGMTQLVATKHPPPEDPSKVPAGTTGPILVSPAVLTWEGWSLSVPRPGRHITNPDPDPRHSATNERPADPDRRALNGVNLSVSNRTTSGSGLPRLRIGRTYRLRARLVDLAGNSRLHDEADLSVRPEGLPQSSEAIRYGRFEPVGTPFVLLDRPPREGESVEWIVARSDPLDSESLAASDAATHRDFVPPRIGQLLAEQHGMLDTPGGKLDGSPEMYELLKKRDRGEFLAVPALPAHGTHVKRVPLEGPLKIPYLPDPMARGVLFVGLPGAPSATMPDQTPAALTHVPFVGSWPDPSAFRLQVQGIPFDDAPASPFLAPGSGTADPTLHVQVPESHIVTVRMSCYISENAGHPGPPTDDELHELGKMGLWQWIDDLAPASERQRLRAEAVQGRLWLLTPSRDITLVHAVKRPVRPPTSDMSTFSIVKRPADSVATVGITTRVHGFSTSKVELLAAWNDSVDDGISETGVTRVPHAATLAERTVKRSDSQAIFADVKHHLGDTKHHVVDYTTLATTSFREYFDPQTPSAALSRPSEPQNTKTEHVLSSDRPVKPGLVSALPAFTWERTPTSSVRRSRTVRVYMARPWFSSGDGEKVAVVFAGAGPLAEGDRRAGLVSTWGSDPAWSSDPTGPLDGSAFKLPAGGNPEIRTNLVLAELPGGAPVSAAIYTPLFDEQRRLWFADVTLKTTSYVPFVRLAIARYQEHSLPGMELSLVAVTDFVQLLPDRTSRVVTTPIDGKSRNGSFTLSGVVGRRSGLSPSSVAVQNRVRARVVVEQRDGEWAEDPNLIDVTFSDTAGGRRWSGQFTYPVDGHRRRLVIEELEEFRHPRS